MPSVLTKTRIIAGSWKLLLLILCAGLLLSPRLKADSADDFIHESQTLIETAAPDEFQEFFKTTVPRLIDGPRPPLARYRPATDGPGTVEFGHDLRRYKTEYVVATSIIPKSQRPDFDQYMTVLTALSLANERAHFEQDRNGSFNDFFHYRAEKELNESCSLYALQQHVSDIVMFDLALKLETHFMQISSPTGLNAVSGSLDRMELLPLYREFYKAAAAKNRAAMTALLAKLYDARVKLNMSGMSECKGHQEVELPRAVIARAVEPAYPYLLPPDRKGVFPFFND